MTQTRPRADARAEVTCHELQLFNSPSTAQESE